MFAHSFADFMDKLIARFPDQLVEALQIGANFIPSDTSHPIQNIVISGLGGSGIGGTIISNYAFPYVNIPIIVNKTYSLPAFVDQHTLLICCSYSGNTEETITVFEAGVAAKAQIVVISSGGKLAELAQALDIDIIRIPAGMPPRSCLGYSMTQLLFILFKYNFIKDSFINDLNEAIQLLQDQQVAIRANAHKTASLIYDKLPIIYAESSIEGVAIRWRQQINENSKMLVWHHVIPEMNHNELVGWANEHQDKGVVFLRYNQEHNRSNLRLDLVESIISKYTDTYTTVTALGESFLAQSIYLIHYGDWVSWEISLLRGVDANEVAVIDYIKSELAKH